MKLANIFVLAGLCFSINSFAGVAVIVGASSTVGELSQDEVSRIFLGKAKKFPNGEQAIPINQDTEQAIRNSFYDKICSKTESQIRAYWSQLIFTGKGTPPKDSGNDADVKDLVSKNPNLIGYIDSAAVDSSVKVIYQAD